MTVTARPKIAVDSRVGHLVIVEEAETPGGWIARCQHPRCSNRKPKREYSEDVLLSGAVSTCGCNYTRNADFPEYNVWKQARARCRNPRHKFYPSYGGRGIGFDDRWDDFKSFYRDMGPRPTEQHQLHRVDNDKSYSPSNCTWMMPAQHLGPGMRRQPKFQEPGFFVPGSIDNELEAKVRDLIRKERIKADISARVLTGKTAAQREAEAKAKLQADKLKTQADFQAKLRRQAKDQARKRKEQKFRDACEIVQRYRDQQVPGLKEKKDV